MKPNNYKTPHLFYYFFFLLMLTLLGLIACLFSLRNIAIKEIMDERQRIASYEIADRIRQSVEDLTNMARLYVMTQEIKYRDAYYQILSIRNGIAPQPTNYHSMYWNFAFELNQPPSEGSVKSLAQLMDENHFTVKEYALFALAEKRSIALTDLEIKAMKMIEGKYEDKQGNYTVIGKPDSKLAQQLLFNDEYMNTKLLVLTPLKDFFLEVKGRVLLTEKNINSAMWHTISLAVILTLLSILLMLSFFILALKSLSKASKEKDLLLLNVLPQSIAARLKKGEQDIADNYSQASVMFADILNFTELTEQLGAKKTVHLLNQLFACFDSLTEQYHVEKVKTNGDNYMAVSGIPERSIEHAINLTNYALALLEKMITFNKENQMDLQFRIGIACGSVVAGVIGQKKFIYDVWGNVVNLASRLEESSLPNKIHISEKMAFMLDEEFIVEPRGTLNLKGLGETRTYFLLGRKENKSIPTDS